MAILNADQSVDTRALPELEPITGDTYNPITMQGAYVHGPSDIHYRFGDNDIDMPGTYVFAGGVVVSGPMSSITVLRSGNPAYSITGLSAPIENLWADAQDNGKLDTFPASIFSGDDTLNGSPFDDVLFAFAGNDTIDAGKGDDTLSGGPGQDDLFGRGGKDVFVFADTLGAANADNIMDFKHKKDSIFLDKDIFPAVGVKVGKKEYFEGKKAHDGNDHIIRKGNKLFYDDDGKGGDKQVLFAKVTKNAVIDHHDFTVGDLVI
ncbi:MAG: hypothetical protein KDJ88_02025 [Bauldia sp.]|nr:hypothetical protein [Bauldia sp.]